MAETTTTDGTTDGSTDMSIIDQITNFLTSTLGMAFAAGAVFVIGVWWFILKG